MNPFFPIVNEFIQKDAIGDRMKNIKKKKKISKYCIHRLPFIHSVGDLIIVGDQLTEAGYYLYEPVLFMYNHT